MRILPPLLLAVASLNVAAEPLKVATWNLGWHLDKATSAQWRAACSAPFELNPSTNRWQPAARATGETKTGWQLPWGRNAPIEWDIGQLPPCNVWEHQREPVPVDLPADLLRRERMQGLLREMNADVLAFQEVSGQAAIEQLLGPDYAVCSYTGHKVQRLALAWRRSLGKGQCEVQWPVALPERPMAEQVRPGLALTLDRDGKRWRFLTVHLKSSCVSPLDGSPTSQRGQLEGDDPACQHLQAQLAPLEAWVEQAARQVDALVWMGDFNRNLAHEDSEAMERPARTDDSAASAPLKPGTKVRNLWREINDQAPAGMPKLDLLPATCSLSACSDAHRTLLSREAYGRLRGTLGCRNPVGLDHIAVSANVKAPQGALKMPLGTLGQTVVQPGQTAQLALSDHCPLTATLDL